MTTYSFIWTKSVCLMQTLFQGPFYLDKGVLYETTVGLSLSSISCIRFLLFGLLWAHMGQETLWEYHRFLIKILRARGVTTLQLPSINHAAPPAVHSCPALVRQWSPHYSSCVSVCLQWTRKLGDQLTYPRAKMMEHQPDKVLYSLMKVCCGWFWGGLFWYVSF